MAIANARAMLLKATTGGYAVGAFNITALPQMLGVVEAAVERKAPLILQTSVVPSKSIGPNVLVAIYRALAADAPIPICLHLDHCADTDWCVSCARWGYTNVMIDASRLAFEENIQQTRFVCEHVHRIGDITVEGELGTIFGAEDQAATVHERLCDPERVGVFVERTGVDLFAPAIGTAHGFYAIPDPVVDFDRLSRIRRKLQSLGLNTPLVIHGGTGLPPHTVQKLVELGGAKFNVSTELKHVLIDSTRSYIQDHPTEYDPGKVDRMVRDATRAAVSAWIDLLGCAGKA